MIDGISGGSNPSQMQGGMRGRMEARFNKMDQDQNGSINIDEFSEMAKARGKDVSKADKVFSKIDVDGDGELTKSEMKDFRKSRMQNHEIGQSRGPFKAIQSLTSENKDQIRSLIEQLKSNDDSNSYNKADILNQLKTIASDIGIDLTA
ncbi:MAG: hypothetical protein COA79_18885 [Planctomycetota bacterium]|nr:MAG: hypothetical protein COA79_18885 [Planctomycetota bacterium]